MNNRKKKIFLCLVLFLSLFATTGVSIRKFTPHTVYRVYLKGKSLGLIKSKKQLEDYIDKKQAEIKEKYDVNKVYIPSDLDIIKETTYDNRITSIEKIYNEIKDISPFTINGYAVKIKGIDTTDSEGKTVEGKDQTIYVLDKEIFTESVDHTVKAFIPEEDYNAFANETQKEIDDTGKIIEKIYIENTITIKKQKIPVNKTIYQKESDLSRYLLFGTTEDQREYIVQDGDTIEDVAFNNKISIEEFLIANPDIVDENSLLYPGQVVTLGILKPQFNVVEEDHVVFREEIRYTTETRYDNNRYVGYTKLEQKGANGEQRVAQKVLKVNGETKNNVTIPGSIEVLTPAVTEIIIKGGKKSDWAGYGTAVPTKGEWGWPASCGSISSHFGWRWGTLHDGTDIAGCGYGSNIFAAQSGTVVESKKKPGYYPGGYGDNGEYIIIDHHNGYYTIYAHLCPNCRSVKVGDVVEKGQVIGGMGATGAATGIHLHYGLWKGYPYKGGRALNAMNYY